MKASMRKPVIIALSISVLLACVILVGWPHARLWMAKREAMKLYEKLPQEEQAALNCTLLPGIKKITCNETWTEGVSCIRDGYRFSLPSARYTRQPGPNDRFESEKTIVGYLGATSLTNEIAKANDKDPKIDSYFKGTDPFQILVDAFNATPKGIGDQQTLDGLRKHLILLLIKAQLQPVGADKSWEVCETDTRKVIVAGNTSMRGISVMIYLPETRMFANIIVWPKAGAQMNDVYQAISDLRLERQ